MSPIELHVKRLCDQAILPEYATSGAACFDLHALEGATVGGGQSAVIRTGLAFEVPPGYAMMVYSRSGHGFKHGVRLANSVGVIDSDYRGEVMVKLIADGAGFLEIKPGDRIAQAMLVPVPAVRMVELSELSSTQRGAGGFGSTGA